MSCEKCCMDRWYCESVRDKWRRKCRRCDQWQQGSIQMFKNTTILCLVVIVLIVVCNSTFDFGPTHFEMPARSTETRIEQRLMDVARLMEEAKTDKILRSKVEEVLSKW